MDFAGFPTVDPPDEPCGALDLCSVENLVCTLRQLLPHGAAWEIGDGTACQPAFLKDFTAFLATHYGRLVQNGAAILVQANPLTATDTSYWLRRWGMLDLIDFRYSDSCDGGLDFETCTNDFQCAVTQDQQRAIEYGLVRARMWTNHPQFCPDLSTINPALAFLGYEAVVAEDVTPRDSVSCEAFASPHGEDCCMPVMALRLQPVSNTIPGAPVAPCPDCAEIPAVDMTCVATDCEENEITRHLAGLTAANFLRRIWPVWQPLQIVEIVQTV
ncbi:MAG: hypothetical protein AB7F96_16525 [Beijerinckiaceae bacterium]